VLEQYGRDFDSIEGLGSDNAEVNKSLADKITTYLRNQMGIVRTIALAGCASHRLSLAVKWFTSDGNNPEYARVVLKIHNLMVALKTNKNRYKLAAKTPLCPETANDTRWDSTGEMIDKSLKIKEHLPNCGFDRATLNLIPTEPEWGHLVELHDHLKSFKLVSKWLQTGENEEREKREVNFFTCRKVFNALIAKYSREGADNKTIAHWLGSNASIIHDKNFESAVEKIHGGESYSSLSASEKRSLSVFLCDTRITAPRTNERNTVTTATTADIVTQTLNNANSQIQLNRAAVERIRPIRHILRVNNICERLFSGTKRIMTDSRRHMDPSTLESLIMLRTNKDMWDERDIQWAIDNPGYFEDTSDTDSIQMQEEPVPSFTREVRQRTNDPEQDDITTISSSSSNRVVPGLGWRPPITPISSVRRFASSSSSSST